MMPPVVYKTRPVRPVDEERDRLLKIAGVLLGMVGLGVAIPVVVGRIGEAFEGQFELRMLLEGVLLFTIAMMILLWIYYALYELPLLAKWLDPPTYVARQHVKELLTIVAITGFLIILVITFDSPTLFSASFAAYLLVDLWSWQVRRSSLQDAVEGSKEVLKAERPDNQEDGELLQAYERAVDAIDSYYFRTPHYRRILAVELGAILLIFLSIKHQNDSPVATLIPLGWVILITASETVIISWRNRMDRSLHESEAVVQRHTSRNADPTGQNAPHRS